MNESHLQAMVAIQRHRGPETSGIVSDGRVMLGHTRLSVVDLAGGKQPMASHDGRYHVTFNGELFNYLELRTELSAAGHRFRTKSDTEVILESYRRWGTACFPRFNGQWAIALHDRKRHQLILSRDRVGIHPLYYTRVKSALLFASEVKALFCHPGVAREFDSTGIAQAFIFWSTIAPRTAFAGVWQLPPASFMVVDTVEMSASAPSCYWKLEFGTDTRVRSQGIEDNALKLREILTEAARLRFNRSDVPIGLYLSGGLDSSVIAAVLSEATERPLETFSVSFAETEFDETDYQELVVQRLGTRHRRLVVEATDIGELFPEVLWYAEQPILRTAPVPLYMLSARVHDAGLKVVLTGEGADEMLGGYDIFREAAARRLLLQASGDAAEGLFEDLYPWMNRSPALVPAFARSYFSQDSDPINPVFSHAPRWRSGAALLRMLRPEFAAPSAEEVIAALTAELPRGFAQWDTLERAQYLEVSTLLSGYILGPQGDRMLMGHSVEGRFPFLDHRLIEFASSLPPEHKLNGFDEKHILKRAFSDLIPPEIASRPKQPYRAPDAASFFAGRVSPDWMDALSNTSAITEAGIFVPQMIEGLFAKCRSREGRGMSNTDNMRVVAVVSLMLLHQQFITGDSAFRRAMSEGKAIPVSTLQRPAEVLDD